MASFPSRHPFLFASLVCIVVITSGIWLTGTAIKGIFSSSTSPFVSASGPGVAIVDIKGVMVDPEQAITALVDCRKNDNIKAVVLRINSPGGVVGAAQEIFTEVKRTDAAKPVIASLGSVAASGGYYAALGARKIIASPGTVTGSIGVILRLADLSSLYDKIGYQSQVVSSGALKDTGNTARPLSKKERQMLKNVISDIYEQFITAVADRRKLDIEQVRRLSDGRVFSGRQAVTLNLVDGLGNFTDAVHEAAKRAGIKDTFPTIIREQETTFSLGRLLAAGKLTFASLFSAQTPVLSYILQL